MSKITAYEILMNQRKKIVEKFIKNMEEGYFFTPGLWNREIFRPQNPISKVTYQGANRLILSFEAIEKQYKDPRWLTYNQAKENGLEIKKEELKNSVICEKWIWTKEVEVEDEENPGEKTKEIIELKKPQVFYFRVYNGSQIQNMPEMETININESSKNKYVDELIENFISSSKCPIKEVAQEDSFYSPIHDEIVLPLREGFSNDEAFLSVLWHEMAHSTGHRTRLNREKSSLFGSEKYAREELIAELSSVFLSAEYNVGKEFEQNHTNYFKSWIGALKENPNELFLASNEASKATDYLIENYDQLINTKNLIKDTERNIEIEEKEDLLQNDNTKEIIDTERPIKEVTEILNELKYSEELTKKYEPFINGIEKDIFFNQSRKILNNLADIESIDSKIKVMIISSESPNFNESDILSFEKANEIMEKEEIKASGELGYNKVNFVLFYPGNDEKMYSIQDRIDIGDNHQKGLKDFIEKNYKINIDEILKESEKAIYLQENPFSEELVKQLKNGTMFPDAIKINENYNDFLKESKKDYEELLEKAIGEKENIDKQYNRYIKNSYLCKLAYYKAESSIPSWTVTGRGNYNFSKLAKRNESQRKAYENLKKVEKNWNNFKNKILDKVKSEEKKAESKKIIEKLAIGEKNPVKIKKDKIGNIDCYRSENYIIVKHYSAYTVLSKTWEKILEKQENIWQLTIPSTLDNRRFSTLRDAKHFTSYLENFSESAESEDKVEKIKNDLYTATKERYKNMLKEKDIYNPTNPEYKKANERYITVRKECVDTNIETEEINEIIEKAKKDLKKEIGEEILASNDKSEKAVEEELTLEIQ